MAELVADIVEFLPLGEELAREGMARGVGREAREVGWQGGEYLPHLPAHIAVIERTGRVIGRVVRGRVYIGVEEPRRRGGQPLRCSRPGQWY